MGTAFAPGPAQTGQNVPNSALICCADPGRLDVQSVFCEPEYGSLLESEALNVLQDRLFPDIDLPPGFLFWDHVFFLEPAIRPPALAGAIAFDGLAEELIADLVEFGNIDTARHDWPIAATAGGVFEVSLFIGSGGEDVLAFPVDFLFAIGGSEVVFATNLKSLQFAGF